MVVREKNCYYAIALTDFFVFLSCAEKFNSLCLGRFFYHQRHATSCEIFLGSGVRSGQEALKAINFARFKTLRFSPACFIPKVQAIKLFITISSLTISSITLKKYVRSLLFLAQDKK